MTATQLRRISDARGELGAALEALSQIERATLIDERRAIEDAIQRYWERLQLTLGGGRA